MADAEAESMEEPPVEFQDIAPAADAERRQRNINVYRAVRAIRTAHRAKSTPMQRASDTLTRFASSAPFLLIHIIWFTVWILWNTGVLGFGAFDPFPFGFLTLVVSLEAIVLSIFVLMAQGREAAIAELREEVTLQVNLRMEAEVTKTLQLVAGLYSRLGQRLAEDPELREMLKPLDSEEIERELAREMSRERVRPPRKPRGGE